MILLKSVLIYDKSIFFDDHQLITLTLLTNLLSFIIKSSKYLTELTSSFFIIQFSNSQGNHFFNKISLGGFLLQFFTTEFSITFFKSTFESIILLYLIF